jgi:hypothetical protein
MITMELAGDFRMERHGTPWNAVERWPSIGVAVGWDLPRSVPPTLLFGGLFFVTKMPTADYGPLTRPGRLISSALAGDLNERHNGGLCGLASMGADTRVDGC